MRIGIDIRSFGDKTVKTINEQLSELSHSKNKAAEFRVNSSETTSALLDSYYTLPASDIYWGVDESDVQNLADILIRYLPAGLEGTRLLPRTFVDIHSSALLFAKELEGLHSRFIYSLKFFTSYFGGAKEKDIVQGAQGDKKASVKTRRIYYEAYLFPINEYTPEKKPFSYITTPVLEITDNVMPAVLTAADRKFSWNVVFDDPDFTEQNLKMSQLITGTKWKRKELLPVEIKGNTIGLHLPFPDVCQAEALLPGFDAMIGQIKKNVVSEESYKPIRNFYNGLHFKSVFSASRRREFAIEVPK